MRKREVAAVRAALDLPRRIKALDDATDNALAKRELTAEDALRAWVSRNTYREIDRLLNRIEQEAE